MLNLENFCQSGSVIECSQGFLIGQGERVWSKKPEKSSPSFFFPDFFLSDASPFFSHSTTLFLTKEAFYDLLTSSSCGDPGSFIWNEPEQDLYIKQFKLLSEALGSGSLQKGVPYSSKRGISRIDAKRVHSILREAAQNKGRGFLFGFWGGGEGMIGVSPEKLFDKIGDRVAVDAVAGTIAQGDFGEKERVEHRHVIEGIAAALAPFGKLKIGKTAPVPYGRLTHLHTPIELLLEREVAFDTLVRELHPTPAIGTYPKQEGKSWLDLSDQILPRMRYGAPAGCILPEKGEERCVVAIRSIQWKQEDIRMYAGGGVTEESVLEKEWDEIQKKFQSIRQMLNV